MDTNKLSIALLALFVILFVYKAGSEFNSDRAAMKNYKEDLKAHPYQHDYVPIPESEINEFYKNSKAPVSTPATASISNSK